MEAVKTIAFAYFGDDIFIGWYADTFGSIRDCPKLYRHSDGQIETITKNFRSKVSKAHLEDKKENYKKKYFALGPEEAMLLMINSQASDFEKILGFEKVELRIVECPIYEGPQNYFSEKIADLILENDTDLYHLWCKEFNKDPGIAEGTRSGIALIDNYKLYRIIYPRPKITNWVSADYNLVKIWAEDAPTKFSGVIEIL